MGQRRAISLGLPGTGETQTGEASDQGARYGGKDWD